MRAFKLDGDSELYEDKSEPPVRICGCNKSCVPIPFLFTIVKGNRGRERMDFLVKLPLARTRSRGRSDMWLSHLEAG